MRIKQFACVVITSCLWLTNVVFSQDALFRENFGEYADNSELNGQNGWKLFTQNRDVIGRILPGKGLDGSKALGVWCDQGFRSDYMGFTRNFKEPIAGVVWIRCRFKCPEKWTGSFFLKTDNTTLFAGPARDKELKSSQIEFVVAYYHSCRLYTAMPVEKDKWRVVTLKVDTEHGKWAAWADGKILGADMDISAEPITRLYVSIGGAEKAPGLIDEVVITRKKPDGITERVLLPEAKKGLVFRFAGIGDPQVGFGSHDRDLYQFDKVLKQANAAGAEVAPVLGDMVHTMDEEKTYAEVAEIAQLFDGTWLPVRGNHDDAELYKKHFKRPLDYSFEHKGFRFVIFDAIGGAAEMTDKQLVWIENELKAAKAANQEIVMCAHVSVWDDNDRGISKYNQIGPASKRKLKELFKEYGVLLMLSGHYHRGPWHAEMDGTHYVVLGGTSLNKVGGTGWNLFDVYPDRIEVFTRPIYFPYEDENTKEFYHLPYLRWSSYDEVLKEHPYAVSKPFTIPRITRHIQPQPNGDTID